MRIVALVITSLLATTMGGCLDRGGLAPIGDAGTAGGSGAAAGRGAGGKGATAGTKGAGGAIGGHGGSLVATGGNAGTGGVTGAGGGPVACPAVACNLACPFGNEVDSNGCLLCKCKPTPCPAVACPVMCPNGSYADASGCDTCKCRPPATCVESDCITPQPPGGPSVDCEDGSVSGWRCQPTPMGGCAWQLLSCPSRCNTISDYDKCVGDPTCMWLAPGCAEPALVTAGCYARANLNCTSDAACGLGHQCLKRVINPCFNAPCLACAETVTVCQ